MASVFFACTLKNVSSIYEGKRRASRSFAPDLLSGLRWSNTVLARAFADAI